MGREEEGGGRGVALLCFALLCFALLCFVLFCSEKRMLSASVKKNSSSKDNGPECTSQESETNNLHSCTGGGVLNAANGPSFDDVSGTHQSAHKRH